MTAESSINPWAEFRRRWRPLQATIGVWVFSLLMLASSELEQAWIATTLILLFVVLVCLWRIGRLKYRKRRCSHCGLWEYDPYNIDGLSERQYLGSGGA